MYFRPDTNSALDKKAKAYIQKVIRERRFQDPYTLSIHTNAYLIYDSQSEEFLSYILSDEYLRQILQYPKTRFGDGIEYIPNVHRFMHVPELAEALRQIFRRRRMHTPDKDVLCLEDLRNDHFPTNEDIANFLEEVADTPIREALSVGTLGELKQALAEPPERYGFPASPTNEEAGANTNEELSAFQAVSEEYSHVMGLGLFPDKSSPYHLAVSRGVGFLEALHQAGVPYPPLADASDEHPLVRAAELGCQASFYWLIDTHEALLSDAKCANARLEPTQHLLTKQGTLLKPVLQLVLENNWASTLGRLTPAIRAIPFIERFRSLSSRQIPAPLLMALIEDAYTHKELTVSQMHGRAQNSFAHQAICAKHPNVLRALLLSTKAPPTQNDLLNLMRYAALQNAYSCIRAILGTYQKIYPSLMTDYVIIIRTETFPNYARCFTSLAEHFPDTFPLHILNPFSNTRLNPTLLWELLDTAKVRARALPYLAEHVYPNLLRLPNQDPRIRASYMTVLAQKWLPKTPFLPAHEIATLPFPNQTLTHYFRLFPAGHFHRDDKGRLPIDISPIDEKSVAFYTRQRDYPFIANDAKVHPVLRAIALKQWMLIPPMIQAGALFTDEKGYNVAVLSALAKLDVLQAILLKIAPDTRRTAVVNRPHIDCCYAIAAYAGKPDLISIFTNLYPLSHTGLNHLCQCLRPMPLEAQQHICTNLISALSDAWVDGRKDQKSLPEHSFGITRLRQHLQTLNTEIDAGQKSGKKSGLVALDLPRQHVPALSDRMNGALPSWCVYHNLVRKTPDVVGEARLRPPSSRPESTSPVCFLFHSAIERKAFLQLLDEKKSTLPFSKECLRKRSF